MILLSSLLFGCAEKRIMPPKPTEQMLYHFDLKYTLDFEQPEIPDAQVGWDFDVRLTLGEVHRDDSLSFRLDFLDVRYTDDNSNWIDHSLTNKHVDVRCFPWGELLLVEGFESVSVLDDVQWLDFIFGALFPNPPKRSGQQWQNRLLPWPFFINPESHSKQIVAATWSQPAANQWEYEGTWYGKRGVTPLFDGVSSGQISAVSPWVTNHTFVWRREITVPLMVTQNVIGTLEQIQ